MAEPMAELSLEILNASSNCISTEDNIDMTRWHDPPSSPFITNIENEDQENMAPGFFATPTKLPPSFEDGVPQASLKKSPEKKTVLKDVLRERMSPHKTSPKKQLLDAFEEESISNALGRTDSKRASPVKQVAADRPASSMSNRSRRSSPTKASRNVSAETTHRSSFSYLEDEIDIVPTPSKPRTPSHNDTALRDNEGLTAAMRLMEETHSESHERSAPRPHQNINFNIGDATFDDTEFIPDGPDFTSADADDTGFSMFSEMPGIDMTKFAALRQTPTKKGFADTSTPRARAQMTPSTVQTVRRSQRTPSPTPRQPRKENDTTNLLLDFTAQFEAFSSSRRGSHSRGRISPSKSTTEPNLLSFYQNQRSPVRGSSSHVPATPSQNRPLLNLLDFELPPPPTPRSMPTVTIRELESLKSNFQSQISSLTASLSGKEAQVESLVQAVSDAEHRVGQAQESLRDERSAREHAEAQMEDWKKKGEEVQRLLQDVQAELARNDTEREQLLGRLMEAERRAEDAETRSSDLETKLIESESKNVDMTTLIDPDEDSKKIYSEIECQTAIAEKVNEVARDLHTAYKAKHEKKIKALKDNYQKKADERCKELRMQIIRLERQIEDAEKKKEDTFSKVVPTDLVQSDTNCDKCGTASKPEDLKLLEAQKSEIESLKAELAGLQSELKSLRRSHDTVLRDLEAERVEKGELVAAAEQMLAMCGERMEEIQQEEFRKSHIAPEPPAAPQQKQPPLPPPAEHTMRSTGFLASGPVSRPGSALGGGHPGSALGHERSGSGVAKPSGLRAPGAGGFGFGASAHGRSMSSGKSRLLSNIERMGGAGSKGQE